MSDTREDSVYLAKLAEQAERYEGASLLVARVYFDRATNMSREQKWWRT
jgi:hypothetical protein